MSGRTMAKALMLLLTAAGLSFAQTCNISGFDSVIDNAVIPLAFLSAITTAVIIGATYMYSQAFSNPKLSLYAKTEAVQLFLSLVSVLALTMIMGTFCSIKVSEIAQLFGLTAGDSTIYEAARDYLVHAAQYSNRALTVVRFHLEAYSVLSALNMFECDFGGIGCLFGYSGASLQMMGGFGAHLAALNIFFNSAIMSQMSALNFLFILLFVYKGFVLLFLPLGVFLRSMPYLRTFGALLMAVTISFLTVYPLMLSLFYLMEPALLDAPSYAAAGFTNIVNDGGDCTSFYDEKCMDEQGGAGQSIEAATGGSDAVENNYFPSGENAVGAIAFASNAFVAAVFLPTGALLATIAAVVYITRLYGEEIDLSRIVQMV
ncbi:MAG: hypothetical protein AB1324_07915 [Candidatus Micrarchaeota archaeon]